MGIGGIIVLSESAVDGISVMFMIGYNQQSDPKGLTIISDPSNAVNRIIEISKTTGFNFTIKNIANRHVFYSISIL